MKNTQQREGFMNRHTNPLPKDKTDILIVYNDVDGEHIFSCKWLPFDEKEYVGSVLPADGYLGTARKTDKPFSDIGFHAWEQNNSEFIYYKIIPQ